MSTLEFKDQPGAPANPPAPADKTQPQPSEKPAEAKAVAETPAEEPAPAPDPYEWIPDKRSSKLFKEIHDKNPYIDISTDSGKKLLERLVDNHRTYSTQDTRIKELEAELNRVKAAPPPQETKPAEPPRQEGPPPPAPPHFEYIKKWNEDPDPLKAMVADELDAYQKEDNRKLATVQSAQWALRFQGLAMPVIQQYVQQSIQQAIQQQIGDVLPALRADRQRNEEREDLHAAIESLKGEDEYKDFVGQMLQVDQDNPELEYDGRKYANTLFNRIVLENPEIAKILDANEDPRKARQETIRSRIRAAVRHHQLKSKAEEKPKVAVAEAKQLAESAAKADADRREQDRIRQSATKGSQTSGPGVAPGDDYIEELLRSGSSNNRLSYR
jgi:hypothetical protein